MLGSQVLCSPTEQELGSHVGQHTPTARLTGHHTQGTGFVARSTKNSTVTFLWQYAQEFLFVSVINLVLTNIYHLNTIITCASMYNL